MACCTSGRRVVADIFMLGCHVGGRMFVAAKAGIGRGGAWVTGDTGDNWIVTVGQREGVLEGGRLPGRGGVTCRAVRSSFASVNILG